MLDGLGDWRRSCYCGQITEEYIGKEVTLMGWALRRRDLGGLIFVDLRDREGIVQIVFNPEINKVCHTKAEEIRSEYVIGIKGVVVKRPPEAINKDLTTGTVEVHVNEIKIFNNSKTLPFSIEDDKEITESIRLKYRYLDLRRPFLQKNLITRHKVNKLTRDYLSCNNFLELETPLLIKSTPEGARDYVVPSRVNPGKFYALPQSPQIFKQLFMIAGFDRYFQIARCLRDEDLRKDRQPEFTQIDIEMSFVTQDILFEIMEGLMYHIFKEIKGIEIKRPFIRLDYKDAIERFGSDKPDTRFEMELKDLSSIVSNSSFKLFEEAIKNGGSVKAINCKGCASFSRKEIEELEQYIKTDFKANNLISIKVTEEGLKSSITKFLTQDELKGIENLLSAKKGDLILCVADKKSKTVYDSLGAIRLKVAEKLGLLDDSKFNFLWVVNFPLFEWDEEANRYVSMHHPFTSPLEEDLEYLDKEPMKVRANAYDMVLNGVELGGGSIRIHQTEIQKKIFNLLGLSDDEAVEKFGFLLEALQYGTPPHGGIAFGMDRLIAILTGCKHIRDVIAFPKTQKAICLMSGTPSYISEEQLKELGIKVVVA